MTKKLTVCPHCGGSLENGAPADAGATSSPDLFRYDLEQLAIQANAERAYDETVKVRVTQEEIRRLVEKRKKKAK